MDVLAGGVLDRHPRLRVAFLEAGSDWLPWLLGRMEHRAGTVGPYYGYAAKRRPSEYLNTGQVYFGFEVEDALLGSRSTWWARTTCCSPRTCRTATVRGTPPPS